MNDSAKVKALLVSALKDMVEMFEAHINGEEGPDDAAARWDKARMAIAKAEGAN